MSFLDRILSRVTRRPTAGAQPAAGSAEAAMWPFVPILNRPGATPDEIRASNLSRLVQINNKWRDAFNPLRGLTIEKAVQLMEAMNTGQFTDVQWVFRHMEQQHPTLLALVERRTSAIVELDWSIRTVEEDKLPRGASTALAKEQKAALHELYFGIDNLTDAIEQLAMATFRGFTVLEKIDLNGDGVVDHLHCSDTWNWLRNGLHGGWYWNPEARLSIGALDAQTPIDEEWFLIRTVPRPLDLLALPLFCRSSLGEKDWSAFLEIFAIPGGVVIGPPNVPKDRESAYQTAGERLAQGGVGYLPNGSSYVPNNPPHAGAPFSEFLRYQQEQLVLAGTGGMLTMLAESGSGTLAGSAHQETFAKIARAEGMRISSDVFQRQLDKPELRRLFPGQPVLAYFELEVRQSPTTKEVIEDVVKLSSAGYRVEPDEITEKTGYEFEDPAVETPPGADPAAADPATANPNAADPALPSPAAQDQPDPEPEDDAPPITNRAEDDPMFAAVAAAAAQDLAPIRHRLEQIRALTDPEAQRRALIAFTEEIPAQAHAILAKPATAEALADSISTAFARGLVAAREQTRKPRAARS